MVCGLYEIPVTETAEDGSPVVGCLSVAQFSAMFDDWLARYQQDQDTDDIDRIYRQQEAQELKAILDGIEDGTKTIEDLLAFEPDFLLDLPSFNDWWAEATAPESEPEAPQTLNDLIKEAYPDATDQDIDVVKDIISKVKGAIPTDLEEARDLIVDVLKSTVIGSAIQECQSWTERVPDGKGETYPGWQDCVNIGAILSIPGLQIPLPPGMIDISVRDLIVLVEDAGQSFEDFISDPTGWVSDKVEEAKQAVLDAWGGITDPKTSGGLMDILVDWGGSILSGVIFNEVKEAIEVEDPFAFRGDCDTEGFVEPYEGYCEEAVVSFDCASVGKFNPDGGASSETDCIEPCEFDTNIPSTSPECKDPAPNGYCEDGTTIKDNPEGTNCEEYEPPLSAEEQQCNEQGRVFNEITQDCEETCANSEHVVGADGTCGPPEAEPEPEPCTNNATIESGCEECADGSLPNEHENADCSKPKIVTGEGPQRGDPCTTEDGKNGTLQPVQTLGFGPSAESTELECVELPEEITQIECPEGTAKAGQMVDDINDCGSVQVNPCDDATYAANNPLECGEDPECNDCSCAEYAAANPEECGEVVINPCDDSVYAAENPLECGGQEETCENGATDWPLCSECPDGTATSPEVPCPGSECVDCTCAEYAAANPEECGGVEEEEEPIGGGGGGGGGSSGMFEPFTATISGDPQLLVRREFPITDYLAGLFKGIV